MTCLVGKDWTTETFILWGVGRYKKEVAFRNKGECMHLCMNGSCMHGTNWTRTGKEEQQWRGGLRLDCVRKPMAPLELFANTSLPPLTLQSFQSSARCSGHEQLGVKSEAGSPSSGEAGNCCVVLVLSPSLSTPSLTFQHFRYMRLNAAICQPTATFLTPATTFSTKNQISQRKISEC